MYLLVLPVSGGGFVSQLGILQHLCESKYVPDLTLASSGGNVAAYVAAAANWKWPAIERISKELSRDLFMKPWNSVSSISMIIGYFQGDIYDKGTGVTNFINDHFTQSTITKYEIWTGTYNKNQQKARIFCNKNRDDSIIDASCIDTELTQSMEPIFADGNFDLIAKAGIASASIPALVPSQKIYGEEYIDGGVAGASPLAVMQEPILRYTDDNNEGLHILYINSIDLSNGSRKPIRNILDTWKQTASDLVRSQTVIDRLYSYELLRCHPGVVNKEQFICNYENIERIKKIQERAKYSMIEIYPNGDYDIDLKNFTGKDVIDGIHRAYKNCSCRFWWITPEDNICSQQVCDIIDECKNCQPSQSDTNQVSLADSD